MLPNFLIVGAEKAGTTTLARMLAQHPDIFMCEPKEPRFFTDHNWDKGVQWYENLFEDAEGYKAIGEASPAYTWGSDLVPKRIYETLGDIKYIYIVRHPVERMISHYRHALFHRWVPQGTALEDAIKIKPGLKKCSSYYWQIERFLPYTKKEQWHVLSLENLRSNPQTEVQKIFSFLEVDENIRCELGRANVTAEKKQLPQWYLHMKKRLKASQTIQKIIQTPLFQKKNKDALAKILMGRQIEKPVMTEQQQQEYEREFFEDVQKFSEFTGCNYVKLWSLDKRIL